jgi:hypothetical protein
MRRHVPVDDPARADVQHDKYVQHPERRRDDDEEIAGEHRIGVVADKGAPLLGRPAAVGRSVLGMYRRTVRGESWMPSFSFNSAAIRSSPHVTFAVAIVVMSRRTSTGTRGRPRAFDLHRQKSRNPLRCQRISVSGFTMVSTAFQSMKRASRTRVTRVASFARRARTRRSA